MNNSNEIELAYEIYEKECIAEGLKPASFKDYEIDYLNDLDFAMDCYRDEFSYYHARA